MNEDNSIGSVPRTRHIKKLEDCVCRKTNKKFLAEGLLRGLCSATTKRVQFSLYLQLIDYHVRDKSIPPCLQLSLKPPGMSGERNCVLNEKWMNGVYKCSKTLLRNLRVYYDRKVKQNVWLENCLWEQAVFALQHSKCWTKQASRNKVNKIIEKTSLETISKMMGADSNRNMSSNTVRDEDHRRWLEEQSQYMQHLSLLEDQKDYTNIPESARSDTRKRIEDEEEELRYLTFINEVTNDILSRGTYSDSVINQIMERHIEKNGNELDITKMRLMLQKLKHELGVQSAMKRSTLLDTSVGQNFDIDKGATTGADSLLELNSHSKLSTSPPVQSVEHRIKSASSNSSVVSSKMSKLSDQNSSDSKKFVITEPANFPLETKANIYESSKGNIVVKQSLPNADSNEILPERDSHSATEESDYESVAALSMVIKPPDSKESTLTKESNHEDGSTMDHSQKSIHDSNESNLTIKGSQVDIIAKAQSKKLNYADEKVLVESDSDAVYDDDFDDEDSGDEF
ncbi:uncharacterized protein LOC143463292 isoform X6 [Clavelina lepadiformis]|uniref:uncharacterized protein LOC143463292 isoform X6 n=1 Tax=Clavelina lepadiformis TaxID=159417 RepID=UPI0040410D3D